MCTLHRQRALGTMVAGRVVLSAVGTIVTETWRWLARQHPYVFLDDWCVMPDHLHGILVLGADSAKTIGSLIGAFKTTSTAEINRLQNSPGRQFWQRDFWDHVIRDHVDMDRVRVYIQDNVANGAWHPGAPDR